MRNYKFTARLPVENADAVQLQLRLAHSYQCALIAIERRRRMVVDRLYQRACPAEYAELDSASKAVLMAIESVRHTRNTGGDMLDPDMEMKNENREIAKLAREALSAAREREKTAYAALRAAKRAATPRLRARMRMCDRGARARNKRAYGLAGTVGLAWGTRLKVDESVERAGKAAAKEGSLPRFPRFDGSGAVVVQLQGGLDEAAARGGEDTRFRLVSVSAEMWQESQGRSAHRGNTDVVRGGPRAGQPRAPLPQPKDGSRSSRMRQGVLARLRIGSDGRQPIWAAWPVTMGRPLPPAPIKWAQMIAHRVGARIHWELMITVDDATALPAIRTEGPTLAVNLGWRNHPDGGLRVAYTVGSDGRTEDVRVPTELISGMDHVRSLQAIRAQRLEALKRDLSEWMGEGERPAWLMHALRYADQWCSPKHAAWLLRDWTSRRFTGDAAVYDALHAWVKQDRHLWYWECDEREKLLRMRKDYYRCIAAKWAREYARILVTDMDLSVFATREAPEEADNVGLVQRVSQRLAAPSELRGVIKNACSTRGAKFEEVDGAYKTQTCTACGVVMAFAAKQDLVPTCTACGVREDQDQRHARNLLASDKVLRGGAGPLAPTVDEGSAGAAAAAGGRWQKRHSRTKAQTIEIATENQ
jgi:hypothetical protein